MDNYHALFSGINALEHENDHIIKMVESSVSVNFDMVSKVPNLMEKDKLLIEIVIRNREAINVLKDMQKTIIAKLYM